MMITSKPSSPAISGCPTAGSAGLAADRRSGGSGGSSPRANTIAQDAEALDFHLHHVTGLQPAAVIVLQDAAGAHRAGADNVARPQFGVPGGLGQDGGPRVVQVGQLAAGPLLAIDPGQ